MVPVELMSIPLHWRVGLTTRTFLFAVLIALLLIPCPAIAQGNPLGPEFRVNTYTFNAQLGAAVATDPSGNFVVVWTSIQQQPGPAGGVYGQRFAASGLPLGAEFRVNTSMSNVAWWSQAVATDSSGNFVVAWSSYDGDGSGKAIFGQRFASSGSPLGPEFRVNTLTAGDQYRPDVSADPSGNFVVVWQNGFFGSGVFGQRYSAAGAPLGSQFTVATYTNGGQRHPTVDVTSSGEFVVAWESGVPQDGSGHGVFAQRYSSSGAPLGSEFRVNTYTTEDQAWPAIASDPSGNFVIVWQSEVQDGDGSYGAGVFGQRYAASGGPLGPEFRVNTHTTDFQGSADVAMDAAGNFVVVWTSKYSTPPSSQPDIFGQRYATDGSPLGPEFRVNAYTAGQFGDDFAPRVAADPMGRFVVTWETLTGVDPSGFGIVGQRFAPILPVELTGFTID